MIDEMKRYCLIANEVAFRIEGVRNTCIHTSLALAELLRLQGFEADVFRATVNVFCSHGHSCSGSVLGGDGDGTRRPKSTGWHGHLAVSCGDYVLDPTIDQADTSCGLRPAPAVFLKPEGWGVTPEDRPWAGGESYLWAENGMSIRHRRNRKQIGWKSKPAALPSRWRSMLAPMVKECGSTISG